MRAVSVFVAGDSPIYSAALKCLFLHEKRVHFAGTLDLKKPIPENLNHPELCIISLSVPVARHANCAATLLRKLPQTKVLFLIREEADAWLLSSLEDSRVGALIYTRGTFQDLMSVILKISGRTRFARVGHNVFLAPKPRKYRMGLSSREEQVLLLVAQGLTSREIGNRLRVSSKTIDTYRSRIFEKLHIRTQVQYRQFAHSLGLVSNQADDERVTVA